MDSLKFVNPPFLKDPFYLVVTTTLQASQILHSFPYTNFYQLSCNQGLLHFVQELLNSDINADNVVMANFEIKSLFTNIPVDETIPIITNYLFRNNISFQGMTVVNSHNLSPSKTVISYLMVTFINRLMVWLWATS